MRDSAPPAPVSSAPVVAGFAKSVARAGLGAIDPAGGSSTVTFAPPGGVPEYVPFSTEPMTVSRSLWDDARGAASGIASDAISHASGAAHDAISHAGDAVRERAGSAIDTASQTVSEHLPGAPSGGAGDADKQFEELYDRLKRELLIEQEQLGQLFHEP
jgi:hypothetical protein